MLAATLAATVYALLTITALLSTVSPLLTSLSSHGKTRAISQNGKNGSFRYHEQPRVLPLRRWLQYLVGNNRFTVNKCRFSDFYSTGILVSALVLVYNANNVTNGKKILSTCLLFSHLIRRYGECKWVHKHGAFSRMHIAGYLLGILHYMCLPFILMPYDATDDLVRTLGNADNSCHGKQCHASLSSLSSDVLQSTLRTKFLNTLAIVGCIYFQYQQHRHHVLLANLRATKAIQYSIPSGGWFEYTSCPHYFSEIMIYVTFAILMNNRSYITREMKVEAWRTDYKNVFLAVHSFRNWILCGWVTTNQAISAYRTHAWYRKSFGTAYPQQRKKLIPFFW